MSIIRLEHNAGQLKQVFDVIKDLVTDVNFVFTETKLYMTTTDPHKIVVISLHMDSLFEYKNYSDSIVFFGINIPHLYKMIRGVTQDHVMKFEIDQNTPNIMKITISHLTKGIVSVTSLYALDLPKEEVCLPEMTFEMTATIPTKDLQRIVKDLSHGSKKISISAIEAQCPRYLNFSTQGDVYSYATSISLCPSETGMIWKTFLTEKISGRYLIKYIEKFIKPQLSDIIDLSINQESILSLCYDLAIGQLSMKVAAIVEDDVAS